MKCVLPTGVKQVIAQPRRTRNYIITGGDMVESCGVNYGVLKV